jgi:hypothetical protein
MNLLTIIPGWIILIVAFLYIRKMKGCECTDKKIVDKLHGLEMFFMGLSAFLLVSVSLFQFNLVNLKKTDMSKFMPFIGAFISVYLSILAYFVYLVYKFYLGVSECKCADDPMKYALYVQGGLYSTTLIFATITVGLYGYIVTKYR